jgi:hypothetical protein
MPTLPTSESIPCPDPACPAVALVVDRWSWPSTDGPVEHVKTQCPNGHVFTPIADPHLPPAGSQVGSAWSWAGVRPMTTSAAVGKAVRQPGLTW